MSAIHRRIVLSTSRLAFASALALVSVAGVAAAVEVAPPGTSSTQETAPAGEDAARIEVAPWESGPNWESHLNHPASVKRGAMLEMTGSCGPIPDRGVKNRHHITIMPTTSGGKEEFTIYPEYDKQTGNFTVSLPVPKDAVPGAYEVVLWCNDYDAIYTAYKGEMSIVLNEGETFTPPQPAALAVTLSAQQGQPGQSVQVSGRCRPEPMRGLQVWAGLSGENWSTGKRFEMDPATGEFSGSFTIHKATSPGKYKAALSCGSGATSGLVKFTEFTVEPLPGLEQVAGRLAGGDRYATAKEIAALGQWGQTVVLASGEVAADALAATPLAAALRAPIVLSPTAALDASARQALTDAKAKGATHVVIAGGAGTLRAQVEEQVRALGYEVERVAGPNRFATAILLAQRTKAAYVAKGQTVGGVFFADGTAYADALAAGPAAAAQRGVLLLTDGAAMPAAVAQAAASFGQVYDVAIGGAAAKAAASLDVDKYVGTDRHDTAKRVSLRFIGEPAGAIIASGRDFPDALAAGALAANLGASLLLTDVNQLPATTEDYLANKQLNWIRVAGGEKSVSSTVYEAIRRAMRK
ncbi:cell wall-binding repeat-containing protein [Buchananella felis]|uniref:cell wall-binding repeat-containing protein n=1 Tax=Buchananella felis TaxID=3231492 RepID=UPI003527D745